MTLRFLVTTLAFVLLPALVRADSPADIAFEKGDDFGLVRPRFVPVVGVLGRMVCGEIGDSGRNDGDGEESSHDGREPHTR